MTADVRTPALRLPTPPMRYDPQDQAAFRRALETWAAQITTGLTGATGPTGATGATGAAGADGVSVPTRYSTTTPTTGQNIVTGAGAITGMVIKATGAATINFYDAVTATGTPFYSVAFSASGGFGVSLWVPFATGLSLGVVTPANVSLVTVGYVT